jgi:hypothetical protein
MNVTSNRNFFDGQRMPYFGSAFAPDFTISLSLDFWVLGYKKIFFKKSYIDAILVLRLGSYSRLVTIPIPHFFLKI